MIVGYGEPYTGTQVETPETAKGEPKVGIQGYAEAARLWREGGWPRGTWAGVTGTGRSAGILCNRHLTGYDRRRAGCAFC
jgi:hypothetical protein